MCAWYTVHSIGFEMVLNLNCIYYTYLSNYLKYLMNDIMKISEWCGNTDKLVYRCSDTADHQTTPMYLAMRGLTGWSHFF